MKVSLTLMILNLISILLKTRFIFIYIFWKFVAMYKKRKVKNMKNVRIKVMK